MDNFRYFKISKGMYRVLPEIGWVLACEKAVNRASNFIKLWVLLG